MKVRPHHIRAALRGFLELLESTNDRSSLALLEMWLGQLAFIQHFVGDMTEQAQGENSPQAHDQTRWRMLIIEQFPRLGETGIPADDLAEIAAELSACLQCWEQDGEQAGLWRFKSGYQVRWGKRLRDLQIYLHNI